MIQLNDALRIDALSTSHEKLASEKNYAGEEIRSLFEFEHIVGRSKAMQAVLHQVQTVAPAGSDVLIIGETGTGKELIARAARRGFEEIARTLLDCGATIEAIDNKWDTPLQRALNSRRHAVVRLLLGRTSGPQRT